jgi:uncharacterized membrane protein
MASATKNETLWTVFANLFLGVWLICSSAPLGYTSHGMILSDTLSGVALVLVTLLTFSGRNTWAVWAACFIGIWLECAPLFLWAPDSVAYLNDTLIGVLVIACSILIPGMPGKKWSESEIPPGWTYNPSSWMQRVPVIAFGVLGWFISRYLAAYQLGYMDQVWDPFFGDGTLRVITSDISKAFPVSDAGLGALAYTMEAVTGCKGDQARWKTMPWMVVFFGILVVPLGVVSTLLIILQPLVVKAWCGLCLCTATAMTVMIALTVDEVVAVCQFLAHCHRQKKPLWQIFWSGETALVGTIDTHTPSFHASLTHIIGGMTRGMRPTWNLVLIVLIGAALMLSPTLFEFGGPFANDDFIFGALTIAAAIIAMAEVTRPVRFLCGLFGFWTLVSCFWIDANPDPSVGVRFFHALLGLGALVLCFRRGAIREHYGSWTCSIR